MPQIFSFKTFGRLVDACIPGDWKGPRRDVVRILLALVGIAVLVVAFLVLVAWVAGIFLLLEESLAAIRGTAADPYTANRNALLILAAVLGVPFVMWRAWLAARQVTINQETQYTANFAKAVEQLGAMKEEKSLEEDGTPITLTKPNIEVRLGAIYALERVMQDSERDAGPIVETLAAYVRENSGTPVEVPEADWPKWAEFENAELWRSALQDYLDGRLDRPAPADRSDVKAALTVLGRRPEHARERLGEKIVPDLRQVNLQGADLDFGRLSGMDMREANLQGATLSRGELIGTDLGFARMDGILMPAANLEGASIFQAKLNGADLRSAVLRGVNLATARLDGADLFNADLSHSSLFNSKLGGADLSMTSLQGAQLQLAHLQGTILKGADLQGANVIADLSEAVLDPDESSAQFAETWGHRTKTKLPKGVTIPDHWTDTNDFDELLAGWRGYKKSLGL